MDPSSSSIPPLTVAAIDGAHTFTSEPTTLRPKLKSVSDVDKQRQRTPYQVPYMPGTVPLKTTNECA
jgi:hypothetical protein